ncbi:unnamed protein product [Prorocentrum cordatum]|uniref:Uncharacterized protein n=1 Tax=Prorocentrum cordatum TaxID=2364126 RepID=A0ABN9UUZ5_9DINO|nr:unnamed protein product [Polarella glacialis]
MSWICWRPENWHQHQYKFSTCRNISDSARFEARVCSAWLAPRRPQASSCGVPSCCGGGDHSAAHPELGVSGASSGRTAADDFDPAGERGAPAAPAARAASLACQAASSPRRRTC